MSVVNVGDRFGNLVVIDMYVTERSAGTDRRMAKCLCDCGENLDVEKYNLSSGNTTRCKKCKANLIGQKKTTHGQSGSSKVATDLQKKCYYTWQAMKARCSNKNNKRYADYGGRGISVCERWQNSFENFLADIGDPPSMDHQIDRINNDGNYEPSNCRWTTREENSNNKRNNIKYEYNGKMVSVSYLSKISGIASNTISARLHAGKSAKDAISTGKRISSQYYISPLGEFRALIDCAQAHGMSVSGCYSRFKSSGFPDWRIEKR